MSEEYADAPRANFLRRPSELLRDAPPKIAFVVDEMLPARGAGVLYAPTGAGKTGFALHLAFSVALGFEFLGRAVTRTPVLYLIGEGVDGFPQRVSALLQQHALEETALDDWLTFRVVPTDLSNYDVQQDLAREVYEKGVQLPRIVILDTYSANAGFQFDENNTASAKAWGDGIRSMVRSLRAMVLVMHHSGWDDSRMRGNSDLLGSADVCLKLTKQGDTARTLIVEKARDFAPPQPLKFALRAKHGGLVCESLQTADLTLQASQKMVLLCLRDALTRANVTHARSSDWQTEAGFSKAQFFVIKNELLRAQYVEKSTAGQYGLTELGHKALSPDLTATGPVSKSDVHQTNKTDHKTGPVESRSLKTGHQTCGKTAVLDSPADVRQTSGDTMKPSDGGLPDFAPIDENDAAQFWDGAA